MNYTYTLFKSIVLRQQTFNFYSSDKKKSINNSNYHFKPIKNPLKSGFFNIEKQPGLAIFSSSVASDP
jgi:hypothetical protein